MINLVRTFRIDEDIPMAVVRLCLFDLHFLMPAMHAAHGIGMHREGQILMYAAFFPEDSLGIRVITLERLDAFELPQTPAPLAEFFDVNQSGCPAVCAFVLLQAPAPQMMRTGD